MPQQSLQDHLDEIARRCRLGDRIAFVSGNFNILHPGHLRLLNFAAECGDFLVVGVNPDSAPNTLFSQATRLDGVRAVGVVGYAFALEGAPEDAVAVLRPEIVVKGKEHEDADNPERAIVDSYGGRILFSSGEMRFSSLDLLQKELLESNLSAILKPKDFPARHDFRPADLIDTVRRIKGLRAVVVGDLIVDEYINCEPLGMSREDPTVVVSPIRSDRFIGGAGIVASHAARLGAEVSYCGVCGGDEAAGFAAEQLERFGVDARLITDDSRPTTLKQRFRAHGKTLLRVSHLRQHDIGEEISAALFDSLAARLANADVLIFSDFNYGCLPQYLVDRIAEHCRVHDVMMIADSQSSSQVGDVSRFHGVQMLTPTEYEARLAVRDQHSGLVVLAEKLRAKTGARDVLMTLGAEGMLIYAKSDGDSYLTDRLPAFNPSPRDVSGAGDSLLACVALARIAGADIWRSAYLGAVAAACQVGRVGNTPITAEEVIVELQQ